MTLDEIKSAVRAGHVVHWASTAYQVLMHRFNGGPEQWFIKCLSNGNAIGLTWTDGVTMNGKPDEFFIDG